MNLKYFSSLLAVFVLFLIAFVGAKSGSGGQFLFGIIIPYLALITFIVGFIRKVTYWASSPVPFRIPTTCGQQKSLPWIKHSWLDTPWTKAAVAARMFLEIVCFRSLFRNTRMQIQEGSKITYKLELALWVGALAFHYAFLVTIVRHLRLFTEPVPYLVTLLEHVDSFFRIEILHEFVQIGLPGFFLSGLVLAAAVAFLILRRIVLPQIRYISLASDFFPLFLILGIAVSGIFMRYFAKIDVTAAKELAMNLAAFRLKVPEGVDTVFFVHLFFVCVLLAYFPFSKLMHLGGIFMSPTRNLTADTREVRHVNPWNYPVPVHTYEEYEDEFREKMIDAGLPVDKQPAEKPEEKE